MGSTGDTTQDDGAEPDNVIRFPKEWFGSKDDLIPFGPSADRIRAERAARAAKSTAGGPAKFEKPVEFKSPVEPMRRESSPGPTSIDPTSDDAEPEELEAALDPNSFWGSQSGALQQPVGVAPNEPTVDPEPSESRQPSLPRIRLRLPDLPRPERGLVRRGAAAVLVLACLALALVGTLTGGSSSRRAASVTGPRPSTAFAKAPPMSPADINAGLREAVAIRDSRLVESRVKRSTGRLTKPVSRSSRRPAPSRHTSSAHSLGHAENVSTPVDSQRGAATGSSAGTYADPSASRSAVSSAPVTASGSASGAGSDSTSSTASLLGGVVGNSCNVQCK